MDTAAYPHPCERIELIETHISWVLLTGEFAYKLKKPVQFSFLDFSTLKLREHFCHEELRCNRAFAPELYVDVLPVIRRRNNSLSMGGKSETGDRLIEWAVQMRQFDPAAQLDRLLEENKVTIDMLADFGRELARRHAQLPRRKDAAVEVEQRIFGPVKDNFAEITATPLQTRHEPLLTRTQTLSTALGQALLPLLKYRMQNGWVRECHGDLHLSNLALIGNKVTAFDCLEFSPNLRWIDTMNDVAFLFMDCHERKRSDLAYTFLDGYLDTSGDYRGVGLLSYFAAYRSMVRAKVAALRWEQEPADELETRCVAHIAWAEEWLSRPHGKLLLMCGLSGAGKSYVAERLVPLLPAVRLRSDVARKALAGLPANARTYNPLEGGLYSPGRSDEVFEHLARVATALLANGDNVIVDATFSKKSRRNEFLALAKRLGSQAMIIYCNAPLGLLRNRIKARSATGNDASEATLQVLDLQLGKFEPPCAPEPVIELATGEPLDNEALGSIVRATSTGNENARPIQC
jgi:aminoglycoside phosphotransferase family enzyme/predicted kinase